MNQKKRIAMEIHFIYNSNAIQEREAFGYVKSLGNHAVRDTDIDKNSLTPRMLADLANKLKISVKELFDPKHEKYEDELADADFDDNDVIQMISEDLSLLKTPILEFEHSARFVESPYDTNSMDMMIEDIKSEMSNPDEK